MIPKIAHFHWTGQPMGWLRRAGISSFKRHNPDWDVRVHDTPEHIRKWDLEWFAQEADWTWFEMVWEHGGFALATDSVFVRPVPEEWLSKPLCLCTNGTKYPYHNLFGAVPRNGFVGACLDNCAKIAGEPPPRDYQSFGPLNMRHTWRSHAQSRFFDMPLDALCPVRFFETHRLWSTTPLELPEAAVGVHWYGGADDSKINEWHPPENSAIVRLAEEHPPSSRPM